jgi:hypothetical protein
MTAPATHATAPRALGVLLLGLAAALVVNTGAGPLGLDLVDYPISGTVRNQLLGLEVVTMALVVPWCVIAAIRAWQGKPDAAALAFAPAAYTLYMFVQYVLGPEYGNHRPVVLLQVAIVTLSGGLTLWTWALMRETRLPALSRRSERAFYAAMLGLALFVVLRYAGAIAGSLANAAIPAEFGAERTFYWSIFLLDLGVVVPATVVGAVALRRSTELGRRALLATAGWFSLVPPSVAAMAVTMLVNDDPNASVGTVVLLSVASLAFAAFAWLAYRPLVAPQPPEPRRGIEERGELAEAREPAQL